MEEAIIEHGYMVVFNGTGGYFDYCKTVEDAKRIRNRVAGGGIIYHATLEKFGLNTHAIRGEMVRKSDGTPL